GFGPMQVLAANVNGAFSVFTSDVDLDGDMDVLSAAEVSGLVTWYANDGLGGFGPGDTLAQFSGVLPVRTGDMDGDGDPDVISGSTTLGDIIWIENMGGGVFGATHLVDDALTGVEMADVFDLESDGDLDVLSVTGDYGELVWYQNDGSGSFSVPLYLALPNAGSAVSWAHADDLDDDGDLDVIAAGSFLPGSIAWYENLGGGLFSAGLVVTNNANGAWRVASGDMNGDNRIDIISASAFDDKVAWYPNQLSTSVNDETPPHQGLRLFPNPTTGHLTVIVPEAMTGFRISDLQGRVVRDLPMSSTPTPRELDFGDVAPGNYVLMITSENGYLSAPFVKY
ncbi:MAG: T9SS type A sorting domain-containing protein, partial [Flavobacteriales bacterium]|nr:T9SS type A sorting domain-containing protein [Flavobacteriales bacterium]